MLNVPETTVVAPDADTGMQRSIGWTGGFWIASGVPALVLLSIGSIAAGVGVISPLVWMISVSLALMQSFVFAEIAGLFPQKSGGTSVFGAMAWAPYSKLVAPLSVWCNWLAWSPVLTIGSGLAAGYVLTALFPADAAINTWSVQLLDLGFLKDGLELRFNATFVVAACFLLLGLRPAARGHPPCGAGADRHRLRRADPAADRGCRPAADR